jgi:hypothetical protein
MVGLYHNPGRISGQHLLDADCLSDLSDRAFCDRKGILTYSNESGVPHGGWADLEFLRRHNLIDADQSNQKAPWRESGTVRKLEAQRSRSVMSPPRSSLLRCCGGAD